MREARTALIGALIAASIPLAARAAPPADADPVVCSRVRALLRLHMYREVRSALRGQPARGRCAIPSDILRAWAAIPRRTEVTAMGLLGPPPPEDPLVGARRLHHLGAATVGGLLVGAMVSGADGERNSEAVVATSLGYGLLGFGFSAALSGRRGSEAATVATWTSAELWGALFGAVVTGSWQAPGSGRAVAGSFLGTLIAGPAAAVVMIGMGTTWEGVAQLNTAGIWSLTGAWLLVLGTGLQDESSIRALMATSIPFALIGGGVWRRSSPLPRWRTTLLDTGAAVGTFGAAGIAVVFAGTTHGSRPVGIAAASGMVAGLVGAHLLAPVLKPLFVGRPPPGEQATREPPAWALGPRLLAQDRGRSTLGMGATLRW